MMMMRHNVAEIREFTDGDADNGIRDTVHPHHMGFQVRTDAERLAADQTAIVLLFAVDGL